MARGSELANILFVAGTLLLVVIFAVGVISLQFCFYACYRRRAAQQASSSQSRRGGRTVAAGGGGSSDPEAAARPTEEEECAVCLAGIEDDGEKVRVMPCCGHGFHALCVDTWLASHATCPLCRIAVAKPGQGVVTGTTTGRDMVPSSPRGTAAQVIVIEIPELAVPNGDHPSDAVKSPGSAASRSEFDSGGARKARGERGRG